MRPAGLAEKAAAAAAESSNSDAQSSSSSNAGIRRAGLTASSKRRGCLGPRRPAVGITNATSASSNSNNNNTNRAALIAALNKDNPDAGEEEGENSVSIRDVLIAGDEDNEQYRDGRGVVGEEEEEEEEENNIYDNNQHNSSSSNSPSFTVGFTRRVKLKGPVPRLPPVPRGGRTNEEIIALLQQPLSL